MEKILIAYSPDGKQIAGNIQTQIKAKGYKSTLGALGSEIRKSQPLFVVAVITADSNSDEALISLLDECEKLCITVVPFVSASLGKSLMANFYLDEHVWIDNVDRPVNDSIGDLIDCLKLNSDVLARKAEKKSDTTRKAAANPAKSQPQQTKTSGKNAAASSAKNDSLYKNLFYICLAVIGVMLFVLIKGGISQTNREAANQQANIGGNPSNVKIQLDQNLRKSESALVGRWAMSDYVDNQFHANGEDSLMQKQMVAQLLDRAQLLFKADKTFQRFGFSSNPESGSWEYDPQSKYLKLQPADKNQYDVVQIQDVTPTTLVIVVQENVESNRILTKMTFTKIANQ
ncbi:MAG: hypothetical protein MJZ66_07835 [Bacteroidales bacterium]|nr:hypothetical protein [Bacteroidales bacterium]